MIKQIKSNEAEVAALAAALESQKAAEIICDDLQAGDFHNKKHRYIFDAIFELIEKRQKVDFVSVSERLDNQDRLEEIGGAEYLSDLVENLVAVSNVSYYVKVIREKSRLRDFQKMILEAHEMTSASGITSDEVETFINTRLIELESRDKYDLKTLDRATRNAILKIQEYQEKDLNTDQVRTGFRALDKVLSMERGQVVVLAGNTSNGKSLAAAEWSKAMAIQGYNTLYFTLEMTAEALAMRFISFSTHINTRKLKNLDGFKLSDAEFERIMKAQEAVDNLPMHIDETPMIKISEIRNTIRNLKNRKGLDVVFIDHIDLMGIEGKHRDKLEHYQYLTSSFKAIAKEFNVLVVYLSQTNRNNKNEKPTLENLRGSGSKEEDADSAVLVHMPLETDPETGFNYKPLQIVNIAKQRDGEIGEVVFFVDWKNGVYMPQVTHDETMKSAGY